MSPRVKFLVGFVATIVVAAFAFALNRSPLLSDLGSRSADVMAANGIADGRANWMSDGGWTMRRAHLSGTADAATRARTIAAVAALDGVNSAVWVELPIAITVAAPNFSFTPAQCQQRIDAVLIDQPIGFDGATAGLATESNPAIEAIAAVLNDCARIRVAVTSHLARAESPLAGLELSEGRAKAVVAALARHGINTRDYESIGQGATQATSAQSSAGVDRIVFAIRADSGGGDVSAPVAMETH